MKDLLNSKTKSVFSVLTMLLISSPCFAKYKLQSMSIYSDLNQDYFVAALHTDERDLSNNVHAYEKKRRIEIRIVSDTMYSRRFSRIWINGSAINSSKSEFYKNKDNLIEFTRCIKGNLKKGDRINIDFNPDIGTSLYINDIFIHTFASQSFFKILLNVLIGDIPLSARIKEDLKITQPSNIPDATLNLYRSLEPTQSRIDDVKKWMAVDVAMLQTGAQEDSAKNIIPEKKLKKTPLQKKETVKKQVKAESKEKKNIKQAAPQKIALTRPEPHKISSNNIPNNSKPQISQDEIHTLPEFTFESLLAERQYQQSVKDKIREKSTFPVVLVNRPEKESIKFTITVNQKGELIDYRQFEKSKHAALNKGAIKLIKKSAPYPHFPKEVQDEQIDMDIYMSLHWRYKN